MSLHRACCCGNQCISDCCTWWACSGSANRTITLSGSWSVNGYCDDGTGFEAGTGQWTLTANVTRIGTDCASYRYHATTATLTMTTRYWYMYETLGDNCDIPGSGSPNYCTHCDNCQCGPVRRGKCLRNQTTATTTIVGRSNANIPVGLRPYAVDGSAVTIACIPDPCAPGCVRPVLIFNPGPSCEDAGADSACLPCGCIDVLVQQIQDGTAPCCTDPATSAQGTLCIPAFAVLGKSECLGVNTFDAALYYWSEQACNLPFFPNAASPCNGYAQVAVYPSGCSSLDFTAKHCDECRDYRDALHACYELDANNQPVFLCYPSPSIVCCSYRVSNSWSWNIA